MAGVRIEFHGKGLQKAIDETLRLCRDKRRAYKNIGEHMKRSIGENFSAGGRPKKWKPIKRNTMIAKLGGKGKVFGKRGKIKKAARRKIGKNKILVDSSRLVRSINYRVVSDGVLIGSNLDYAAIHQFGGIAGRGAGRSSRSGGSTGTAIIPARPYLVVQKEDDVAIASIMEQHLVGGFQ